MKKTLYIFGTVMLIALMALNGCKKDDVVTPPVVDTTIPNDVFPLKAGNRFDYTGYFTNADTETPITGTSTYYSSSWTLGGNTLFSTIFGVTYAGLISANNGGRTSASLIYDSTLIGQPLIPAGTFKKFTPVFAYYDTATADYYYMTNLGYFFRSSRIRKSATDTTIRSDSLRFIKLASPKAGVGGEFSSFEGDFVTHPSGTTIKLKISGKWESKIDITVNGKAYPTYYLVISRIITIGTGAPSAPAVTAKLWLAKGIGPVKMLLIGDPEAPGNYRELKTTNF